MVLWLDGPNRTFLQTNLFQHKWSYFVFYPALILKWLVKVNEVVLCVLPVKDLGLHLITLQEQAEGDELWRLKRACVKVHLVE